MSAFYPSIQSQFMVKRLLLNKSFVFCFRLFFLPFFFSLQMAQNVTNGTYYRYTIAIGIICIVPNTIGMNGTKITETRIECHILHIYFIGKWGIYCVTKCVYSKLTFRTFAAWSELSFSKGYKYNGDKNKVRRRFSEDTTHRVSAEKTKLRWLYYIRGSFEYMPQ